jgi:hypothetical protein
MTAGSDAVRARFLFAILLLLALPAGGQGGPQAPARVPVLVELFTSEGCSSCPPADSLLIYLEAVQDVPGAEVVALGLHVDYWNHIGWTDRFSSAAFSDRQTDYAHRFRQPTVYTPQVVVDGRVEVLGSDVAEVRRAIAQAAARPKLRITLQAEPEGDGRVEVKAGIAGPLPVRRADVLVAVTEGSLASRVLRGENQGRRLHHTAVVRSLEVMGRLDGRRDLPTELRRSVRLDKEWKRENLRLVVFVQERGPGAVLGAASLALQP